MDNVLLQVLKVVLLVIGQPIIVILRRAYWGI